MKDRPKNIVESIHTRLTNIARTSGRPYSEILQYYAIERFLYRLSKTKYAGKFILKGGLVFYVWDIPLRRATKDIDFLGLLDNRKGIIKHVVETTARTLVIDDGLKFDPSTILIEEKQVDADSRGIRAKFIGYLGRSKINMQIDFGFSDEISSKPELMNYPTLLKDLPKSQLIGYPIESVVAEKFHAMERFESIPSRWKDYYDIWLISSHFELDDQPLEKSIGKTFEKRNTAIPIGRPDSLSVDFASKHKREWALFLKKSDLENDQINDLLSLVENLWAFLSWPLSRLITTKHHRIHKHWTPTNRIWE